MYKGKYTTHGSYEPVIQAWLDIFIEIGAKHPNFFGKSLVDGYPVLITKTCTQVSSCKLRWYFLRVMSYGSDQHLQLPNSDDFRQSNALKSGVFSSCQGSTRMTLGTQVGGISDTKKNIGSTQKNTPTKKHA